MTRHLENPETIVQQIQAGDSELREQFIADSLPFVRSAVRRLTHSFFVEQDDEFSLALEAYNTAISQYRAGSGVPFEPYALLLIKNRLLNWIRSQQRLPATLSLSDQESEDGLELAERLADPRSEQATQNLEFADSMAQVESQLSLFGYSMLGLADKLPRHQDSRLLCLRIARQLADCDALYQGLLQNRRLPGAELARRCAVPLKTIEKNRSSIILLALLLHSDLQTIRRYLAVFEKEGSK